MILSENIPQSHQTINSSLKELLVWFEKNGCSGYDPYDIRGTRFMIQLIALGNRFYLFEIIREGIFELLLLFPLFFRKLFRIRKKVNAKAMGLMASSYLDLYQLTKEDKFKKAFQHCFTWLDNNKVSFGQGIGWGYPFSWKSANLIPANTPNGIVTTAVGEAYWKLYKNSGNVEHLNTCKKIAFFLSTLPIDRISKDEICFSYTPIYINHVHNLNLFVAEFLIKVGTEISDDNLTSLGLHALNYSIACQEDDGSFDYNGPPEKLQKFYDNYHTAFVIRMLYSMHKMLKDEKIKTALDKCVLHWKTNFFEDGRIPKFTPNRLYRIDVHSSAEAINCLAQIDDLYPGSIELAENIALWTIENLQDKTGYFYHGIFKSRAFKVPFKSKIAYTRWAQAWMLKGLSSYLLKQNELHLSLNA